MRFKNFYKRFIKDLKNLYSHNFVNCFIHFKMSYKFVYSRFLGRSFRIRSQNFEIQNVEKFYEDGFSLETLITNPLSDFKNSRWRFQSKSPFVISDPKTS